MHVQNGFQGGLQVSDFDEEAVMFVWISPVDEDVPGSGQRGPYPRPARQFRNHALNLGHLRFNSLARVLFQAFEEH